MMNMQTGWSVAQVLERLIYQTDNARIFHCTGEFDYQSIKSFMNFGDNKEVWFLASDTNHKADTWLIYLRK